MSIADGLIRVSTGIEDVDDLIGDFHQALRRTFTNRAGKTEARVKE